jgi:hypothetical protein
MGSALIKTEKMKKIPPLSNLLLLMMLIVTPSTVLSATSILDDLSFGVSVLRQESSLTLTSAGNNISYTDNASGIELYAEQYYQGKYRYKGSLTRIAYDDFDITELMFAADYLIPMNPQFSLFAGGAAGVALQQFADTGLSDSSSGLLYGAQLGGIYYLNKYFMAELGYRLRFTQLETEVIDASNSRIELEQLDEMYISLLLLF